MNKTKIWLITAAFLVIIGSIIFAGVMTVLKWDFAKLQTAKFETNNYEINEKFNNISVVTDTADIVFKVSENQKTSVVCYEQKNAKHSVSVKEDALVIEIVDTRKWYEHIGIMFGTPEITVYIPQGEYGELLVKGSTGDVEIPKDFKFESIDIVESTGNVRNYASASKSIKIKTSTGDIKVQNVKARKIDLLVSTGGVNVGSVNCEGDISAKVSTGKTNMTDVTCKNIVSGGSTGGILMKNVIATEKFTVERSTGDIRLEKCDAADIQIKTDTGDINGTLLSGKIFTANSDTGNVKIPESEAGGKCKITTDTGDIKIGISNN
jgi:DUF4097 and DUF4098 domain-containing protein YvlB